MRGYIPLISQKTKISRPVYYNISIIKKYNKVQKMEGPKPVQTNEQNNQHFLLRQLQKYLQLYTDADENRTHLFFSLIACRYAMDQSILSDQLFMQINSLLDMVKRIKNSLMISQQNQEAMQNGSGGDGGLQQIPQFILKDIKKVRRTREENAESVANKLKVIVSKTMQKQSSNLKYNYSSYVSLLLEEMGQDMSNEPIKKMREQFRKIRQTFNVVSLPIAARYRQHPSSYVQSGSPADFFISFYCERLLFFQDQPLPFNGNILFVPVMLDRIPNKETSKIAHTMIQNWYINELYKQNNNWQNFSFELIFKDTLHETILHYFCASHQKKSSNENDTCVLLSKIRMFVYFGMIFNYLQHVLVLPELRVSGARKAIRVLVTEQVWLQIGIERQCHDDKLSNPRIIQDFLRYFSEQNIKKRAEMNKKQVTLNFQHFLQCLLAKTKYNVQVPQDYLAMKPKYIYVGQKRVQI